MLKEKQPKKKNVRLEKNIFLIVAEESEQIIVGAPGLDSIYRKSGRLPKIGNILNFLDEENNQVFVYVTGKLFKRTQDGEEIYILCEPYAA